jgi:hypothetical protein
MFQEPRRFMYDVRQLEPSSNGRSQLNTDGRELVADQSVEQRGGARNAGSDPFPCEGLVRAGGDLAGRAAANVAGFECLEHLECFSV